MTNNVIPFPAPEKDPDVVMFCKGCDTAEWLLHAGGKITCAHCEGVAAGLIWGAQVPDDPA